MEIHSPLCITSRLLPGVKIGEATISIEYADRLSDYNQRYRWYIDNGNGNRQDFQGDDLCSGVGSGALQEGLESLLSFLGAFAEAQAYKDPTGETGSANEDLFPAALGEWAVKNADEITRLECDLQENPGKFIVE